MSGMGGFTVAEKKSKQPTLEDYILRSISKTSAKRWEYYAVTRILHTLNDLEIEFICQQCVRKPDGRLALTDMYFPQFKIYLEINEGHHFIKDPRNATLYQRCIGDAQRAHDIALAAGLTEYSIPSHSHKPVTELTLDEFNQEIDDFVEILRRLKAEAIAQNQFEIWDFEMRFSAQQHIDAGFIEIGPHAAFHTHVETLKCFGCHYKAHMQGSWNMPDEVAEYIGLKGRTMVWFPNLDGRGKWSNSLSEDGMTIVETNEAGNDHQNDWDNRIVFARSKDVFGKPLYRFVGVFEPDADQATGSERRFTRVSTKVKTYNRPPA